MSSWQPYSMSATRMVTLVSGQEKRAVIISMGCIRAVIVSVSIQQKVGACSSCPFSGEDQLLIFTANI